MKPTLKLGKTTAPDGANFVLQKHDGEFFLHMDGVPIMSSTLTHSERLLADIGCNFSAKRPNARILIGGLGLGFSLRRTLELSGPGAKAVVAEYLAEVIRWNQELLEGFNDDILKDPRTEVVHADVYDLIRKAAGEKENRYDVILLDVDDGPSSLIQPQNKQLYDKKGLTVLQAGLTPGGRIAFWCAGEEKKLMKDLGRAGFRTEEIPCAKHPKAKRLNHRIYLAERKD